MICRGDIDTYDSQKDYVGQSGMDGDLLDALTEREQEILSLIAEGLSNQAIADRLFLTLGTVKW